MARRLLNLNSFSVNPKARFQLIVDLILIIVSVLIAVVCLRLGIFDAIIQALNGWSVFGIFIAGIFFTSVFTTAPAIVLLSQFALTHNPILVALVGGLGSVIGDMIIFKFVKDRFSSDLSEAFRGMKPVDRLKKLAEIKFFRGLLFFVGGFILASPLPDELGVTVLGFSRMNMKYFLIVSYIFNSFGIVVIGLIARGLF